jgi:hypothetical protein
MRMRSGCIDRRQCKDCSTSNPSLAVDGERRVSGSADIEGKLDRRPIREKPRNVPFDRARSKKLKATGSETGAPS